MMRDTSNERGFTLAEILISLLVLSLVTVGAVRVYNSSMRAVRFGGEKTGAVHEAQGGEDSNDSGGTTVEPHLLSLSFANGLMDTVQGYVWKSKKTLDGSREVSLTRFIPESTMTGSN